MSYLIADAQDVVPLSLVVEREGVGGIAGLSPTVALRLGEDPTQYLDWSLMAFKASGWVTKYKTMTGVERGHYYTLLSLPTLGAVAGASYVAQFNVNNGADVQGEAEDVLLVTSVATDAALLRKALTNRMEESPGNPGQLTLFDDDGFTVLARWQLTDTTGGAVVSSLGTPARRSARV
jgi:hypothetical protein